MTHQLDMFARSADDAIAAMWSAGKSASDIACAVGLNEVRVYHELSRILRERAPVADYSKRGME